MNIPLIVCGDSDKTTEYVRGRGQIVGANVEEIRKAINEAPKETNTRDYILKNWSEFTYMEALNKWIVQ
jgi:hypothetical protein